MRVFQVSKEHAAALLEYSLADIEDGDADSVRQLQGVPLQLQTGAAHLISCQAFRAVYVLNKLERQLLSSQPGLLVQSDIFSRDTWNRC